MTAPCRIHAPSDRRRRIHLCLSFSLLPLFSLLCVPPSRGIGRRLGSRPTPPGRRAPVPPPVPAAAAAEEGAGAASHQLVAGSGDQIAAAHRRYVLPALCSPLPLCSLPLSLSLSLTYGGHQPPVERRSSSSVNSRVERRSSSSVNSRVKSPRAPSPRRRSPRVPAAAMEISRQSHGFQ